MQKLTLLITVFSKNEIVFARTSPQHKLEIGEYIAFVMFVLHAHCCVVKRAQALGHIVGV